MGLAAMNELRVLHETVNILGVDVHCVDFAQMLAQIQEWIDNPRAHSISEAARPTPHAPRITYQICTTNPEFIIEARRNPAFAAVLRRADLRVPDGMGLLWAARLMGVSLRERVTGSDGIYRICERAARHGWRVFLLGAAPGIADRAGSILEAHYPGLNVSGTHSGSPSDGDWPAIHRQLEATSPDIVFVAFGHPKQDLWIDQHRAALPATVAIGVGGAFDFVAGVTARAPRWMQRAGLEWLYRLIRQPWRIWRMLAIPQFMVLVLRQWLVD